MWLKTFLAKDMKDALSAMRAELGDEAIIVARETMKDGSVLLRAGIEEGAPRARALEEAPPRNPASEAGAVVAQLSSFEAHYRETLLARLRAPKPEAAKRAIAFDRATLLELLLAHRTPDALVETLVDEAEKSGLSDLTLALASVFDKRMRFESFDAGKRGAIFLIGPPGAGKTAVAAKLAAQNCRAGHTVRLAATDLDTAGQVARLESFAACLNVDVVHTPVPESLAGAVQDSRAAGALLIADSAGCDPRESLSPDLMAYLSIADLEVVGVVSAASDAEEAAGIADALAKLGAAKLIVTGLDLARRKGALAALAWSGLPIAHTTASPYLADGLQTLTPLALSRALVADAAPGDARKVA